MLDQGMLDVGDGQRLHWEVSGNPEGKPAVVLHGGPGSGSTPWGRRWFDPRGLPRASQLDQRGSGRQHAVRGGGHRRPATNTTAHLGRRPRAAARAPGPRAVARWPASPGARRWRWPTRRPTPSAVTEMVLAVGGDHHARRGRVAHPRHGPGLPRAVGAVPGRRPAAGPRRRPRGGVQPVAARRGPAGPRPGRRGLVCLGGHARRVPTPATGPTRGTRTRRSGSASPGW